MGDFNTDMEKINLKNFCDLYNFENLIKEPTCYKNPVNPTCTDLMLTIEVFKTLVQLKQDYQIFIGWLSLL